jgi:hypothetical protein
VKKRGIAAKEIARKERGMIDCELLIVEAELSGFHQQLKRFAGINKRKGDAEGVGLRVARHPSEA